MHRGCSPTRRTPSPTRRETREPSPRRHASSASSPRKKAGASTASSSSSSSSTNASGPTFSALKFAARPKVPRGDAVLPMKTEHLALQRVGARTAVIPEDRFEPQTLFNDEEDFHLLRRQFAALSSRHRNRWVKAKLEAPCGQEWQTLLDCYLDKGAHPMLCLDEEAAMRRCQQKMVYSSFTAHFAILFFIANSCSVARDGECHQGPELAHD